MIIPYLRRKLKPGQTVKVYRNLNRPDGPWYSVMQGGRVIGHAKELHLAHVRFEVSEAGRQRVLATKRKNVHAFVLGIVADLAPSTNVVSVRYNPYQVGSFFRFVDGQPVQYAPFATLDSGGIRITQQGAL